jgi:DNA mismatch endonuclease (patch repair protein)
MTDIFTKKTRSWIMSRIHSKYTQIEKNLASELRKRRLKFLKHYKMLGSPDFVFLRKKVVVFVDGVFWHGYNWKKLGRIPPDGYWREKISRTINRDKQVTRTLKKQGWTVLRFWEHEVLNYSRKCADKIAKKLKQR